MECKNFAPIVEGSNLCSYLVRDRIKDICFYKTGKECVHCKEQTQDKCGSCLFFSEHVGGGIGSCNNVVNGQLGTVARWDKACWGYTSNEVTI